MAVASLPWALGNSEKEPGLKPPSGLGSSLATSSWVAVAQPFPSSRPQGLRLQSQGIEGSLVFLGAAVPLGATGSPGARMVCGHTVTEKYLG